MNEKTESMAEKFEKKNKKVIDDFTAGISAKRLRDNHLAIHTASVAAAGVALSPIPFTDASLIIPIQMAMIVKIYDDFGYKKTSAIPASIVKELSLVAFARALPGNLLKFIPILGTIPGDVINVSVAVAITEALGWTIVKKLDEGGEIDIANFGNM